MVNQARLEATQRIAANMSERQLVKASRLRDLYTRHVSTLRDAKVKTLYDRLTMNTQVGESKLAGILIMGESGSGKTHIIRSMESLPEFQPYRVPGYDYDMLPYITLDAPPEVAPNFLLAEIIKACGFPVAKPGNVPEMLTKAFEWFEKRRVMFVHIDEFQHALRNCTPIQLQRIQDTIKELMQIDAPWPVQIILSGTPIAANFRKGDKQLHSRVAPLELDTLDLDRDAQMVMTVAFGVITQHAGLGHHGLEVRDFSHKLLKAANFQFGNVIDVVRLACDFAITEETEVVGISHFAQVYSLLAGVSADDENLFISENWKRIAIPESMVEGSAFEHARKKRRTFKAK